MPAKWQRSTDEEIDTQLEIFEKWHDKANERIKIWFGLRTIFNNSDQLITRTKEIADKYKVGLHMHVAEIEADSKEEAEKKLQESLEDYVKSSKPLMDKFYAKSIQGTAYLPGHEEKNSENTDEKKDSD